MAGYYFIDPSSVLRGQYLQLKVPDVEKPSFLAIAVHLDVKRSSQVHGYKEILHQKLVSVLSELEDLRIAAEKARKLLKQQRSLKEYMMQAETRKKESVKLLEQ